MATTTLARLPVVVLLVLAELSAARPVEAEDWPQKPVRIVVPYPAGGSSDVAARILAQHLSGAFGRQFVVEDRPGASGALAADLVAHSNPDGYTLLMASTSQISVMPLMTTTRYDPVADFAPISMVGTNPFVLTVHPSIPVATLGDFVAYVRASPTPLSYAGSGVGSLGHLAMELWLKRAGLEMTPVMYKGGTEQINAVVAGHVKVTCLNLSAVAPFATSGALRALAVTSEKRSPRIPDVPTLIEAGYAALKVLNWVGLMAPAATPSDIVDRIAGETSRAVRDPKLAALLLTNGIEPLGSTPQEFAAVIADDVPLWTEAVKLTGLQSK